MRLTGTAARLPLTAIAICALISPAVAQVRLVQSSPQADSSIGAPRTVKLTFSEKIAPALSGLQLSMADGMALSLATSLSDDGTILTGRPTSPFMAGKWTLSWHAAAAGGGQPAQGSFSFTVR